MPGHNGCIVDEAADLKLAARSMTFGAAGTTGQRCTSTRRVIAQRAVVNELVELLKQSFAQIKVGDPREPGAVIGPLVDAAAVGHFEAAIGWRRASTVPTSATSSCSLRRRAATAALPR